MRVEVKTLRLFGRWEDVPIQGTERTCRLYACHPLDRIITTGLVLLGWAVIFLPIFSHDGPGRLGVRIWEHFVIYVPTDRAGWLSLFQAFLLSMAIPTVLFTVAHVTDHLRQRRILRGELTARRGVLCRIGRQRTIRRGGPLWEYRLVLHVVDSGKMAAHEVYEMPEPFFKEFEKEHSGRACLVELVLLPPKDPDKQCRSTAIPDTYRNMLHMRLMHIFWLQTQAAHCKTVDDFLFIPEANLTAAQKLAKKAKSSKPKSK